LRPAVPRGQLALLVGVDSYPLLPPENQLRSCANDARLVAHVLRERFGFEQEAMTLLIDGEATREAILAGLGELKVRARPGDSVVFYFSGHGSKTPDREGDEPDGWDETLVPYDGGRPPHPQRDIVDDEIHDWILGVSEVTPFLTLIADTCFAGGVARKVPRAGEKWIEPDRRRLPARGQSSRGAAAGSPGRRDGLSGFLPVSDRYTLLAACHAGESAKELTPIPGEREPYSAFTFFLCQELLRAPKGATYRDVIERTRVAVAAAVRAQTPLAEGARDRRLFGVERIEPASYLAVEARDGARLRLGGGAVHGVGLGSTWGIYRPDTRQPKGAKPLGVARVSKVLSISSEADIIRERGGCIEPGARAFEQSKGPGWMRLSVAIETADPGRVLSRRIQRSAVLRLAEDGPAEARVLTLGGPKGDEEAVLLSEKSWVALGEGSELLLPPVPVRQPGSAERLVDDLETRARYLNLLRLIDEEEDNPLRGCLDVQFLRLSAQGDLRPARAEKATGEIVYREGESLALRIGHRAERPLYFHVLDLGLAGGVGLLYPLGGSSKAVAPGYALDLGVQVGQRIRLRIPPAFAAWVKAGGGERRELEGKEFLKIFATTEPADLSWLAQPSYGESPLARSSRGAQASPIWRALGGKGKRRRDSATVGVGEEPGWTVATLGFLLRGR